MAGKIYFVLMSLIVVSAAAVLYLQKPQTELNPSYSAVFQVLGIAHETAAGVLLKAVPVDTIDEKQYGEALRARFEGRDAGADGVRINKIMNTLQVFSKKGFSYRVYISDEQYPNAFALPGGVIVVTRGLIGNSESDGELAAVLSHEMGHVELSHCIDRVKMEIAAKKLGIETVGKMADMNIFLMMGTVYSKTQENEADEYAWQLLVESRYDPLALSRAFQTLKSYYGDQKEQGGILRDYYSSHPPLDARIEKFSERGRIWHKKHPGVKREA